MSEENRRGEMDIQKNYRSASAPANSTDPKSRDGARANPSPRYGKKSYGGNKGEPTAQRNCKPVSQRSKSTFYDKRPRSRNSQLGGRRDEVTNARRAEFGSALSQGSKKMNLNHLLNFSLVPRESSTQLSSNYASWKQRHRPATTKYYNKEQFLQANCQFVVKSSGDYSVHAVDPDVLVDWDLIEQVRIFGHQVPSCPICLYPPKAAKVTRCGHTYCWACILHYLALGERTWRKCPICYEAIHQADLKSVVAMESHHYVRGECITMKLMKRAKTSVISLPQAQWTPQRVHNSFSLGEEPSVVGKFAKILLATPQQVQQEVIGREVAELAIQAADNGDDPLELSFIRAAQVELQGREKHVFPTDDPTIDEEMDAMVKGLQLDENNETVKGSTVNGNSTGKYREDEAVEYGQDLSDIEDELEGAFSSGTVTPSNLEMEEDMGESEGPEEEMAAGGWQLGMAQGGGSDQDQSTPPDHAYHYFYQVEDGQHLYLDAINARCLAREYGSLQACPPTITATILHIQHHSMNQDLRKRIRYLRHLPLTCEFGVCELVLKPPTISQKTLDFFAVEIDKRKKMRDKKLREEKRWEQKIKMQEQKKQGKYPKAKLSLGSHRHFPSVSSAGSPPRSPSLSLYPTESASSGPNPPRSSGSVGMLGGGPEEALVGSPVFSVGSLGSSSSEDMVHPHATLPPSFAQMLREGKAKEAWGVTIQQGSEVMGQRSGSGSDAEDFVPAPVYGDAFGNAIQEALDRAAYSTETKQPGSRKEKKNKKGKKKQLLFTTAIQAHHK